MTAQRLTLSRSRGFDLQKQSQLTNSRDAAKVDRSTVFGNPFHIIHGLRDAARCVVLFRRWLTGEDDFSCLYPEERAALIAALPDIRGKNLACWCQQYDHCHADVLLEIANKGENE